MNKKIYSLMLGEEDKLLIDQASKIVSLSNSSFIRSIAVSEARKILQENKSLTNQNEQRSLTAV